MLGRADTEPSCGQRRQQPALARFALEIDPQVTADHGDRLLSAILIEKSKDTFAKRFTHHPHADIRRIALGEGIVRRQLQPVAAGTNENIDMFAEAIFEGALQPVLNLADRCRFSAKNKISGRDKRPAVGKSQLFRQGPEIGHDKPLARAENDAVQQGHIVIHRCRLQ